jgi:hypothetical protein
MRLREPVQKQERGTVPAPAAVNGRAGNGYVELVEPFEHLSPVPTGPGGQQSTGQMVRKMLERSR